MASNSLLELFCLFATSTRVLTSLHTLGVPSSGRAIVPVGAEKYPLNLLAVVRAEGSVLFLLLLCRPWLRSDVHQAP